MKASKFWDFTVVSDRGDRLGLQLSLKQLRGLGTYIALGSVLLVFTLSGWMMSRWQSLRAQRQLASERLKSEALETQLGEYVARSTQAPGLADPAQPVNMDAFTLLPSLDGDAVESIVIESTDLVVEYETVRQELSIKFDLVRKPPLDTPGRYYWIVLLHGPQGIMSFPPALASRKGEPILSHRGEALDNVRVRKTVEAHYRFSGFLERVESEPVFATLLLYDAKGSLMLRQRRELLLRRAGSPSSTSGDT